MTLQKRYRKGINNIQSQLKEFGDSILIWPTGLGKTHTSMEIACGGAFKNVIYLSPFVHFQKSIKESYRSGIKKLQSFKMYSFAKLRSLYKNPDLSHEFFDMNNENTLFIIDECHMACARITYKALMLLKNELCPNAKYLGLTATPQRADKKNPIYKIFNGHIADEYYISQAIMDGIFPKPKYIAGTFELDDFLLEQKMKIERDINDLPLKMQKSLRTNLQKISNMDISYTLNKWLPKDDYIKMIIFFPLKSILKERSEIYKDILQKLFPDYHINMIKVYSGECEGNAKKIDKLRPKHKTIDMITSINMVSMSYHFDDLTCIIMDRATASQIIYLQQIGRCINIKANKEPLIFDIVGNYDRYQYVVDSEPGEKKQTADETTIGEEYFGKGNITFYDERISFANLQKRMHPYQIKSINGWNLQNIIQKYLKNVLDISVICGPGVLGISEDEFLAHVTVYKEKMGRGNIYDNINGSTT